MEKKPAIRGVQGAGQSDIWLSHAVRESIQPGLQDTSTPSPAHASLRERESIRRAIPCSMLVNFGTTYAIASNVLDISLTGTYLDLDAAGAQLGDAVEVVISFAYQDKQIEHRLPATIVRLKPKGVGLKFDAYDNQTYTDLVNLLYAA